MRDVKDFNNISHRVASASAVFQKGIYHLFLLKTREAPDMYARVLRMYQCLFQLCLTQLLLDLDYKLNPKDISKRLRQLCQDPANPTRKEVDPAAIITHSVFENGRWPGAPKGHYLEAASKSAVGIYLRVVEARHHLIYRPFMLDGPFWEDCTLMDLLAVTPEVEDIERAFREFVGAMMTWHGDEDRETDRLIEKSNAEGKTFPEVVQEVGGITPRIVGYFLRMLFMVYEDRRDDRPTETLLLTYARMMNPDDPQLLDSLREYRNWVLDLPRFLSEVYVQSEWRAGEL